MPGKRRRKAGGRELLVFRFFFFFFFFCLCRLSHRLDFPHPVGITPRLVGKQNDSLKWNGWGYADSQFALSDDGRRIYFTGKRYKDSGTCAMQVQVGRGGGELPSSPRALPHPGPLNVLQE